MDSGPLSSRRSARLPGYDYTLPESYFVTLCAWQRNYYEHIIRDEREHRLIAGYMLQNPANWQDDDLHPR